MARSELGVTMYSDLDPVPATTTWAIGDVHGCVNTLVALLSRIESIDTDPKYLFVGDLVGKGPSSIEVLELVYQLAEKAVVVLGNHDLHLLAISHGIVKQRPGDFLDPVLGCSTWDWRGWLENRPLVHLPAIAGDRPWIMTHAGIHPDWSIEGTVQRGELLSDAIVRQNWDWYRNEKTPIGYVAQILTRMRTLEPDGTPEIEFTGGLDEISNQSKPWFQFPSVVGCTHNTISGHWAALGHHHHGPHHCIDGGCVYGGSMIGLKLETAQLVQIPRLATDALT